MNPGIFYLYEYENNQRRKNVGFIKISRQYQTCMLQIHIRGMNAGNGSSLELYAFYREQDKFTGSRIAVLNCFGKSISSRLPVPERTFPDERPLSDIDGFLIKFPGDGSPVFWMASSVFFPADLSMFRVYEKQEEPVPDSSVPEEEPVAPEEKQSEAQSCDAGAVNISSDLNKKAKKIQRDGISVLPRRFWFLANNSFLLHGYHNYNHLILAEENGRLWLGVPGVYDPREAKAADLFGFPQFTREYRDLISLEDDERSDSPDFGYWCRCVGSGCPKD